MMRGGLAGIALILCASGAWAENDRESYAARMRAELEAQAPAALPAWDEANEARQLDPTKAAALYRKVVELAPEFDHAHRRLCSVLSRQERHADAVQECERALAISPSIPNEVELATALLIPPVVLKDAPRARALAEKAIAEGADKAQYLPLVCRSYYLQVEPAGLASCARELEEAAPGTLAAAYFSTLAAEFQKRWDDAAAALERAHRAGLPDDEYEAMKAELRRSAPARVPRVVPILGVWVGLLVLLTLLGSALSAATLYLANRGPGALGPATTGEKILRGVYGVVIRLCILYFSLSVPLLALAIPVLGGLAVYIFLKSGWIPLPVLFVIFFAFVATLWAVFRVLFLQIDAKDPGERLDVATEPTLAECLRRVAAQVGAPQVDHVYMTPGTELAVFERGGYWRRVTGRGERCLILGAGLLDGMTMRDLEPLLAHEHGHLRNADTAGGRFAAGVRRAVEEMLDELGEGGRTGATLANPTWWFLNGFHRMFLTVTWGASRLQEILADRWAILAYGSDAFARGLQTYIERSLRFDLQFQATLRAAVSAGGPLPNLYQLEAPVDGTEVDKLVAAALGREPEPYDSHPSPAQRIAWARALAAPGTAPGAGADDGAWKLFKDRAAVEARMMSLVVQRLSTVGFRPAVAPATPAT